MNPEIVTVDPTGSEIALYELSYVTFAVEPERVTFALVNSVSLRETPNAPEVTTDAFVELLNDTDPGVAAVTVHTPLKPEGVTPVI